jgi:hypothetical protein
MSFLPCSVRFLSRLRVVLVRMYDFGGSSGKSNRDAYVRPPSASLSYSDGDEDEAVDAASSSRFFPSSAVVTAGRFGDGVRDAVLFIQFFNSRSVSVPR